MEIARGLSSMYTRPTRKVCSTATHPHHEGFIPPYDKGSRFVSLIALRSLAFWQRWSSEIMHWPPQLNDVNPHFFLWDHVARQSQVRSVYDASLKFHDSRVYGLENLDTSLILGRYRMISQKKFRVIIGHPMAISFVGGEFVLTWSIYRKTASRRIALLPRQSIIP